VTRAVNSHDAAPGTTTIAVRPLRPTQPPEPPSLEAKSPLYPTGSLRILYQIFDEVAIGEILIFRIIRHQEKTDWGIRKRLINITLPATAHGSTRRAVRLRSL